MQIVDRELLELAAKAVGIHLTWGGPDKDMPRRTDTLDLWSPHTDDGDALRLAAKLLIQIYPGQDEVEVIQMESGYFYEPSNGDVLFATRRAIVRAAAEIGRQMREGGAA